MKTKKYSCAVPAAPVAKPMQVNTAATSAITTKTIDQGNIGGLLARADSDPRAMVATWSGEEGYASAGNGVDRRYFAKRVTPGRGRRRYDSECQVIRERKEAMSDRRKPLVMVIDPDPKTSTSLLPLLAAEGYRAASCSATGRSLTAVLRRQPDLVIVSKQMESCDGMILIGRIKEIAPDTRAILLVDPEDWPSLLDAFDAGADDLQRRRPGANELLESARRLLEPAQVREPVKGLVRRSG